VYGGQNSEGFLVDHHLLLIKQRNDTELDQDVVENNYCVGLTYRKKILVYKLSMLEV